jgi:SAM-dependent methyltransferase
MTTGRSTGTAAANADLWGARARDWADVQEGRTRRLHEAALDKVGVGPGTTLLDVGCGAGGAMVLAATRGATVTGIDATPELVEIAKQRLPGSDIQVGEIEALPYPDDSFDVVVGFNAFQFAADPVNALAEARRVARPGATVVIATWGKPEESQVTVYLAAMGRLLPPPPPGAPGPFALSSDGALAALAVEAGLTPCDTVDVPCPWSYPDLETTLRGLLSSGTSVRAIRIAGEERIRDAVTQAIQPFKQPGGGYRIGCTFRYLIARA